MKPKKVPRLWCALQGLLPLESRLAPQRGKRAWPPDDDVSGGARRIGGPGDLAAAGGGIGIAVIGQDPDVGNDGPG